MIEQKSKTKSEITKEKIIEKSIELFSIYSFNGTSIKFLAKEIGISQGLLYNYFPSKDSVLYEIFKLAKNDIEASFIQNNKIVSIDIYFETVIRIINKNKNLWRLIHSIKYNNNFSDEIINLIGEINLSVLDLLNKLLNKINPNLTEVQLKLIFATIDGLVSHYLILPNYDIKSEFEYLQKIIKQF